MLKARYAIAAAAVLFSTAVGTPTGAQQPPPPAPAAQTPPGQPPAGRGRGPGTFPAQQRPPGDPAVIARGKGLYEVTCALCHGIDLRGGQLGGVNLLRSQVVLTDKAGEQILPIVRGARADKGMPPIPMEDADVKAVAEYIHSIVALSPRQGMPPPPGSPPELNVLVGDATAGQAYFATKCSSCHSPTGDMQGIATRIPDPKALQNLWVSGGAAGGRGGRGGGGRGAGGNPNARVITVTVTLKAGKKVEGRLLRLDDFLVSLVLEDGTVRSFSRDGAIPKVEVHNPLEPHIKLLAEYTDKDMHNVTAYLATLK
jgi:cytochrome c oxidase cbb3-type subunit 3